MKGLFKGLFCCALGIEAMAGDGGEGGDMIAADGENFVGGDPGEKAAKARPATSTDTLCTDGETGVEPAIRPDQEHVGVPMEASSSPLGMRMPPPVPPPPTSRTREGKEVWSPRVYIDGPGREGNGSVCRRWQWAGVKLIYTMNWHAKDSLSGLA